MQKTKWIVILILAIILLAIISGCGRNSKTTPQESVIDLSNSGDYLLGFGNPTDEVKRWQIFVANEYPKINKIEVMLCKWDIANQNDVTVELYKANDFPYGSPLATSSISTDTIGVTFTVENAPLTYNGLISGLKYAIVLGQKTPHPDAHYCWCTGGSESSINRFGKYTGSEWVDESSLGNGWLKVYVSK